MIHKILLSILFFGFITTSWAEWRIYGGLNSSSLERVVIYSAATYDTSGALVSSGSSFASPKFGFEVIAGYEWRPSIYFALEPRLGYYRHGAQADISASGLSATVTHHIDYLTTSIFAKFYFLRFDSTQFFVGIAPTYSFLAYKKLEFNIQGNKFETNILGPRPTIPGAAASLGQVINVGKNKLLVEYVFHIGWDVFPNSPPIIMSVSHQFNLGYAFSF